MINHGFKYDDTYTVELYSPDGKQVHKFNLPHDIKSRPQIQAYIDGLLKAVQVLKTQPIQVKVYRSSDYRLVIDQVSNHIDFPDWLPLGSRSRAMKEDKIAVKFNQ